LKQVREAQSVVESGSVAYSSITAMPHELFDAKWTQRHPLPTLPTLQETLRADLPGIRQTLAATRHLLEMYRRSLLDDEKTRRKLQRLDGRLLAVADQLKHLARTEK
jgi:hypothetical protein